MTAPDDSPSNAADNGDCENEDGNEETVTQLQSIKRTLEIIRLMFWFVDRLSEV